MQVVSTFFTPRAVIIRIPFMSLILCSYTITNVKALSRLFDGFCHILAQGVPDPESGVITSTITYSTCQIVHDIFILTRTLRHDAQNPFFRML